MIFGPCILTELPLHENRKPRIDTTVHMFARVMCVFTSEYAQTTRWYARVERKGKGFTVLTWRYTEAQGDALFLQEVIPVEVD